MFYVICGLQDCALGLGPKAAVGVFNICRVNYGKTAEYHDSS